MMITKKTSRSLLLIAGLLATQAHPDSKQTHPDSEKEVIITQQKKANNFIGLPPETKTEITTTTREITNAMNEAAGTASHEVTNIINETIDAFIAKNKQPLDKPQVYAATNTFFGSALLTSLALLRSRSKLLKCISAFTLPASIYGLAYVERTTKKGTFDPMVKATVGHKSSWDKHMEKLVSNIDKSIEHVKQDGECTVFKKTGKEVDEFIRRNTK